VQKNVVTERKLRRGRTWKADDVGIQWPQEENTRFFTFDLSRQRTLVIQLRKGRRCLKAKTSSKIFLLRSTYVPNSGDIGVGYRRTRVVQGNGGPSSKGLHKLLNMDHRF